MISDAYNRSGVTGLSMGSDQNSLEMGIIQNINAAYGDTKMVLELETKLDGDS